MAALFEYPKSAEFGRIVAKNKIYDRVKPSRKIQDLFSSQVSKIIWRYKLAPKTTNLAETERVKEIEIFELPLKTEKLDKSVLRCIDKAIAHPIIFHLTREGMTKVIATHKRPSEADTAKWVIGDEYFETDWLPADTGCQQLPVVLNLTSLYEYILREIIPIPKRENEPLESHISRMAQLIAKNKEYKKLEAKMSKEKQFNRKVEMNGELRTLSEDIVKLKSGAQTRKVKNHGKT